MDRKAVIKRLINMPKGVDQIIIQYDYYIEGIIDSEIKIEEGVKSFKVLKDGKIFIYSSNTLFILLDGNIKYTIENKIGAVRKMIILPDNRIAVLSNSNRIGIINPNTRNYDIIYKGHNEAMSNNQLYVINHNEDKYDILSIDKYHIIIWDPNTREIKNQIISRDCNFLCQVSTTEIVVSRIGFIISYDLITKAVRSKISTPKGIIIYAKPLTNGKIWTISSKFSIDIYDFVTKKTENLDDFKLDIYIHHLNNKYIIIESERGDNLYFWNTQTLVCDYLYFHNLGFTINRIVLPDERIAVSFNNRILIFDIDTQKSLIYKYKEPIMDLLPDGRIIIALHDTFLATLK